MLLLVLILLPVSARANLSCTTSNVNKTLTAATISVPAAAQAGTTVATLPPESFQLPCFFPNSGTHTTSATLYSDFATTTALAPGFNDVYKTNIAGLGIRYTFNSSGCSAANAIMANGLIRLSCPYAGPLGGSYIYRDVTVTATFVVTAAIAAGASSLITTPKITIGYATSDGGSGYWQQEPLYTGSASGTLVRATCSVNQSNIVVSLPTADTRAFQSGIGAVAAPQAFSLSLSCVSGAKILITLTDAVDPSNRTDRLTVTHDSTTTGIGVQVLNSTGSPVLFGADSANPNNANHWVIGDAPNGTIEIPLTARYIRTGTVSPGQVKVLATFTMSYQ
ncbi:fimbrial protein [Paraburkholderia sp.]|uniref:fimbrial protein n=1 Tax=Paraburkholderia sp. TaxID=1926495 RepID=UPI002395AAD7|nr:fimbrial protein [Paraburkholderia sp.]MDE1180347.1 fimbrial protein [Paraburkholderia sp.]